MARASQSLPPGVATMTVPTGGGKTLASVVWALGHALRHGLDRVIIAIPFTSITEQTANVLRMALGDLSHGVVEHHSAYQERGDWEHETRVRKASENWDAPIIVTTNVQLYESLFAAQPSKCRKLHNIARSVVIVDEAQSLSPDMVRPTVAMIEEMARAYRTSWLLCTATQPTLVDRSEHPSGIDGGLRCVKELMPTDLRLHERLRRVRVVASAAPMTDGQFAAELTNHRQALAIVNTRSHARDLFTAMRGIEGTAHLSALMCPAHRSIKLEDIRRRLTDGKSLRLISTSVIEAGVDLDFPRVWRAMAGLSSIAQAAGRCNREGMRDVAESVVTIFEPAGIGVPRYMVQEIAATRTALAQYIHDPLSTDAIRLYFAELYARHGAKRDKFGGYHGGLDRAGILPRLEAQVSQLLFPFEEIADEYRLIDSLMTPIVIPYDDDARQLIERLRVDDRPKDVLRRLQRYTVQVSEAHFNRLATSAVIERGDGQADIDAEVWTLRDLSAYSNDLGLLDLSTSGQVDHANP